MPELYATRVPYKSAMGLPGRAGHPILKIFFFLFALVAMVVLLVVGLVVLVIDIILLPFRLLFHF